MHLIQKWLEEVSEEHSRGYTLMLRPTDGIYASGSQTAEAKVSSIQAAVCPPTLIFCGQESQDLKFSHSGFVKQFGDA